jgi:hypothetical protein
MALYACPQDSSWEALLDTFDTLMEQMHKSLVLPEHLLHHQRGNHATIGIGYGFGSGRVRPGEYVSSPHNSLILQTVLDNPVVQRIACYVDRRHSLLDQPSACCSFELLEGLLALFPKPHTVYTNLSRNIIEADNPKIKRSFPGSCYPACTFNLHSASTLYHSDFWNWLFSMCAIFSGGKFDHKRSSHFIAWGLGIAVEFPRGSTIYIPSAAVPHSNSPIAADERRHSMVFFLPAGLVSYYHSGFRSDKDFRELATPDQLGAWLDHRQNMWKVGLDLLKYPI